MSLSALLLISYCVISAAVVATIILAVKMGKAVPPRKILKKYTGSVWLRSIIPRSQSWKTKVELEDHHLVERFGKATFIMLLFMWILAAIAYILSSIPITL